MTFFSPTLCTIQRSAAAAIACMICMPTGALAQYSPYFFDGFDVTEAGGTTNPGPLSTFDLNTDIATRQGGPLAPVTWVTNAGTNDFQHQLFPPSNGAQPLQLAEVGVNTAPSPVFSYKTMVSPDYNFKDDVDGEILGKRISFTLDVGVIADEPSEGAGTFTSAGITIGAPDALIDSEDQIGLINGSPIRDYFSLQFVEDQLPGGLGAFMQAFDGADGGIPSIGTTIDHGGSFDTLSVQLDIDDPSDGNPWDGVGSTVIDVTVDGNEVYSFEKTGGGYTDNFITFYGIRQLAGNSLATHTIDEFTVFTAPLEITGLSGDFNDDGVVNAADYTLWRNNLGDADETAINGNGDGGDISIDDYNLWRTSYGDTAGAGSASAVVPEPVSISLLLAGIGGMAMRRRR